MVPLGSVSPPPGAPTSILVPVLEKEDLASSWSNDDTVMASRMFAGKTPSLCRPTSWTTPQTTNPAQPDPPQLSADTTPQPDPHYGTGTHPVPHAPGTLMHPQAIAPVATRPNLLIMLSFIYIGQSFSHVTSGCKRGGGAGPASGNSGGHRGYPGGRRQLNDFHP